MKKLLAIVMIIVIGICGTFSVVWAEGLYDQKFAIGIRGGTFLGDGEPSNDLPMFGIYGRYNWSEKWNLGLSLDYLSGDFERPYKLLGISPTFAANVQCTCGACRGLVISLQGFF